MNRTTKRAIAALPATLLLAMSLPTSPAMAVTPWNQGFESDTDGWLELPGQEAVAGIKRVGSGYAGITSASGDNHAVVTGPHMFTRFGGYTAEWDGTWSSEVDVYLDPAWEAGAGFDYSVAANGSNGAHKRDFIVHLAKDADTNTLLVGASNNTDNKPRTDLETRPHAEITEAGWYTVRHTFRDNAGVLAVDIDLVDRDGHVVFTQTLSDPADTIATLGGNRYAWFTALAGTQLAIDDSQLTRPEQEPGRSYSTDFTHVAITKADQARWRMAGAYDAAIVTKDGDSRLRISNATTSGSFGDMLYSPTLAVSATEATTDNRFEASFVIDPVDYQEGLVVTVSPDNGEGGRNGFLRVKHLNRGMTIEVAGSYLDDAGELQWEYKDVATGLDVSKPHTVNLQVVKRPGAVGEINDVFRAWVDGGKAIETGTFEAYYFANKDAVTGKPEANHPTDALLFRVSGTAASGTLGQGILIDDLSMSVSTEKPVVPPVTPPVNPPVDSGHAAGRSGHAAGRSGHAAGHPARPGEEVHGEGQVGQQGLEAVPERQPEQGLRLLECQDPEEDRERVEDAEGNLPDPGQGRGAHHQPDEGHLSCRRAAQVRLHQGLLVAGHAHALTH